MKRGNKVTWKAWMGLFFALVVAVCSVDDIGAKPANAPQRELTLEDYVPKQGLAYATPRKVIFSHDGKFIAYQLGRNLEVIQLENRQIHLVLTPQIWTAMDAKAPAFPGVQEYVWSPQTPELLFVSNDYVYRWKVGDKLPQRLSQSQHRDLQPRFLPGGQGIIFVRKEQKNDVLVRQDLDFRNEKVLATIPAGEGVYWHEASPDGKFLAFATSRWGSTKEERVVNIPDFRGRFLSFQGRYRPLSEDGLRKLDAKFYTLELTAAEAAPITIFSSSNTDFNDSIFSPSWSADSSRLVFSVFKAKTRDVQIWLAQRNEGNSTAGKVHSFQHQGGPDTPLLMRANFLSDNRRVALLAETSGYRHLEVLDLDSGKMQPLTSGSFEVIPVQWSNDRSKVYVAAAKEHPACQDIYEVSLNGGSMRRLTRQHGFYDEAAVSPDGCTLIANYARFGAGKVTVQISTATGQQTIILNDQPEATRHLTTVRPEFFNYTNRHGDTIQGYMFKPTQTGQEKKPLAIYVYGGPLGTDREVKEGNYREETYTFLRYMTEKHGYVTCVIDPRGSSGYGARFEKANFEQPGRPQVEDLEDGVKFLVDFHGVDADRVGVMGWSFGGFQTQMCLYTSPKVFKVGIAVAGVSQWENYYGNYAAKVVGNENLQRFSLLPLAKNLEGRLLLIHGAADDRVLFQDSVRIYQELRKQGKELHVEFRIDWTGDHFLDNGDLKTLDRLRLYEDFLLRSLGRASRSSVPEPGNHAVRTQRGV